MHGGIDTAGDAGGENTEPLPILGADTEVASNQPLRPLTDLSYDFAATRHSPRSLPRFALPRIPRVRSKRLAAAAASVSAVVAAAAAALLLWPHGSAPTASPPTSTDSTAELRAFVPAGFADSCQPESSAPPASAHLTCTGRSGPSAPGSARFTLAQDAGALPGLLRDNLKGSQVVVCPGNIQSPVLCPTGVSNAFGDLCR